ncbi:MAG TPA: amidohydrolase family protein [Thermotogota bacterium]|nr:amidohydrolase family protein [Thermotogota bacterium]HQQ64733.1 amidohydrolase family protein [Thermotogota bacterium]
MNDQLYQNYFIFTGKSPDDYFRGNLWVRDGRIVKVFGSEDPIPKLSWASQTNGEGKTLLPGMINAHTHLYSTFACGLTVRPFHPGSFEEMLEQLWWKLDRALLSDDVYWSAKTAAMRLIDHGVTTIIDHHSSPYCVQGTGALLSRALIEESGMRAVLSIETSDRDGAKIRDLEIEENLALMEEKQKFPGKMGALFGLHASFTLGEETLKRVGQWDYPVHIHIGEGDEDGKLHEEKYGCSAFERLQRYDVCKPNSLLVHGIRLSNKDTEALKKSGCRIAFNPQSNQNNGAGLPHYERFKERAIPVLLGNDGFGFDFSRDIRALLISQHHVGQSPLGFSLEDLFEVVFRNNAAYASALLGETVGVIEEGAVADFVTFRYMPITPISEKNFLGHWFFGILESGKPEEVVIGGNVLKTGGVFRKSPEEMVREAEKVSRKLWERMEK